MIIIKLGGSVITDKNIPFTFRPEIVRQLASEFAQFYPEKQFIFVHGAGSFGHILAKKYAMRQGLHGENVRHGIAKTHQGMQKLNTLICDIFLQYNLPVYTLTASSLFLINKGEIVKSWMVTISELVEKGFITVLYGDPSVSIDKGMDVLSGDQIITCLAAHFKPKRVIFIMDVDGVYNKNPKKPVRCKIDFFY